MLISGPLTLMALNFSCAWQQPITPVNSVFLPSGSLERSSIWLLVVSAKQLWHQATGGRSAQAFSGVGSETYWLSFSVPIYSAREVRGWLKESWKPAWAESPRQKPW